MWRALVLLAGCNQVYDLQPTRARDGGTIADPDDRDADGIADALDNCPTIANTDQADLDGDATGDLCDDCALVANEQAADADGDGLGDLCDPHPAAVGDCVLVVDTFADEAAFLESWVVSGQGTATPAPGSVVMTPEGLTSLLLEWKVPVGATDMFVRGTAGSAEAGITAIIASNKSVPPYTCRLDGTNVVVDGPLTSIPTPGSLVPATTVTNTFVSRILTNERRGAVDLLCRADYGISVATAVSRSEPMVVGEPAIAVNGAPVTLDAVVLLRYQPAKACPPTIYR